MVVGSGSGAGVNMVGWSSVGDESGTCSVGSSAGDVKPP